MDITQIDQHIFHLTQELAQLRAALEADHLSVKAALKTELQVCNAQLNRQHSLHLSQMVLLAQHIKALKTLTHPNNFVPVETESLDSVSGACKEI
ncbi:hypothetical protein [Kamptonema sp. PCC 6506]|uniref:hypothetical protein n=1 Tax=Kamptonema sp. PCC 6506 TaxID=272129 RepID=UPI000314838B|nr:hypothetical protein [Kamptonema sp. PCC 6506]